MIMRFITGQGLLVDGGVIDVQLKVRLTKSPVIAPRESCHQNSAGELNE
jgi:hypothetical protein